MHSNKIFFAHNIDSASTSGARFYRQLCEKINNGNDEDFNSAEIILFNIYTPFKTILIAKFMGKRVALRVDGLWNDRLSPYFFDEMGLVWRNVLKCLMFSKPFNDFASHLGNFVYDNYKSFLKIFFADGVVYQSDYSKKLHEKYFDKKKSCVILNGFNWSSQRRRKKTLSLKREINFCVVYSRAPLKGIYEAVKFVEWLNHSKNIQAKLTIIGFNGNLPPNAPTDFKSTVLHNDLVAVLGDFEEYGHVQKNVLLSSDIYLCLSRADPCPNALIECMSFGLPVLGLASGGVPEIVGEAGYLVNFDDFSHGFFFGSRYEYIELDIPYEMLYTGLAKIANNYSFFVEKVQSRFKDELDMAAVSKKYINFLDSV